MDTVGKRIRYLRTSKKLSMADLGEVIGTDSGNISNWENDKRMPGGRFIIALSRYFNVSTDWILFGEKPSLSKDNMISTDALAKLNENEIVDVQKYIEFLAWRKKN